MMPQPSAHTRNLRIIHSEAATAFGGQEYCIFKEMLAMRARGHLVEAMCQPHAQLTMRLREAGFTVHPVGMDGARDYVRGVLAVRNILRAGNYDVVNTHSRVDTVIAASAARLARVPLIVRTRHLANPVGSLLSYTWLPQRVIAVSDYVRRHLIERGVRPTYVATVYSPIDLPPVVTHSTLRQELGLSTDAVVVGCVAVMRATKGHGALVRAMAELMANRPHVHLVLVGGGSPVFERIQAQVAALGLSARIHLLGERHDVPNLLAGFDLFALATEQEALGTVYIEAQASGLAVIGTDVGGVSETFVDGETGLLVPPGDHTALTDALRRLIDDPERRGRMGEAGRRYIRDQGRFTAESCAERTEQCYLRWLVERGD